EDRDERDRQREEGEEDAVRDRGRVLRAAVGEHVLDRPRKRAHDTADDPADVHEWTPCESLDPSGRLGGAVAHSSECTAASSSPLTRPSRTYARTASRFPLTVMGGTGSTIARGPSARNVSSPISTEPTGAAAWSRAARLTTSPTMPCFRWPLA